MRRFRYGASSVAFDLMTRITPRRCVTSGPAAVLSTHGPCGSARRRHGRSPVARKRLIKRSRRAARPGLRAVKTSADPGARASRLHRRRLRPRRGPYAFKALEARRAACEAGSAHDTRPSVRHRGDGGWAAVSRGQASRPVPRSADRSTSSGAEPGPCRRTPPRDVAPRRKLGYEFKSDCLPNQMSVSITPSIAVSD